MKKYKALDVLLLCVKILIVIFLLVPFLFCSYQLIRVALEDLANAGSDGYYSGLGLYLFASHVVLFLINAGLTLMSILGLIIAKKYKRSLIQNKNVLDFKRLTFTPLCCEILYILITVIILNVG